jgi:UDP-GlcNAc:undecaprenyl-phosphate/decaprenyl-phosphate GlcNAc-1-phosphate transferase
LPLEARLGLGLLLALAVAYSATLLAIRVAVRFEFYDKPVGYKGHARPTPYLGGAAVIAGFLLALLAINADSGRTLPLVTGIGVLWAVGTLDDRHTIAPSVRVAVEALLALLLWATGLGWDLGLGGAVDLVLTILWVIAVVNAFNLFDNMDGAASTMALVVSAGVVAMGIVHDDTWLAVAAVALCGACLGFLPHNLASPARIFLGDGGSMPIGFAVAALVMVGAAEAVPAWQALVVGLLLVGVPALDTGLVMISRRRRGVSVLTGGRDHLTHRTQRRLRTARAVAIALGAIQALVSSVALFAVSGGGTLIVLIVVLYLVAAATAIALLEAGQREQAVAPSTVSAFALGSPAARLQMSPSVPLVVLLGVGAGASSFFGGFYDEGRWLPIGLALLAVVTAGAIARPPRLTRAGLVALTSLAALAAWALLSSAWAPSIEQATTEGNRMFVLCAILATALVLVRSDALGAWLVAGLVAGIGAVGAYVLARLLGSHPNDMFIAGRLSEPLGYINAQATVFIMGFWLCFAVMERRTPWLAGAGAAGATLMACLALLPQSRGAALATIGSLIAVMALVPGDRMRRSFALLACGAGVAGASGPIVHVYDVGAAGSVPTAVAHHAAVAMLVGAAAVGVIWAGVVLWHARVIAAQQRAALLRRTGLAVLAICAVAGGGVALASASRVEDGVSRQWSSFVSLGQNASAEPATAATTRLATGSGYRYDYWRIAVDAFAEHPVLGVGAGNYDRPYLRDRRTSEDVRQPHSIELQALSELGIVGGGLLACFIAALVIAAVQMRAAARRSALSATLMVGAVGVVSTWLAQTSVDWLHLMPGVTGIALVMVSVLALNRGPAHGMVLGLTPRGRFAVRPAMLAAAVLAGVALVVSAASLSRQGLADVFRHRADDALAARPADAIREADRSLRLDSESPRTYYVKAAALARFNEAEAARRTLLQAASKEPDNFVTWTLLGDLAVRRGRFGEAKRNYVRASALNPRDPGLARLALDPHEALRGASP